MKTTIISILSVFLFISCSTKNTIEMIKQNPSNYVVQDHFVISNFKVLETSSFMNYSISIIDDTTDRIIFISSKPYAENQIVGKEKVRYMKLYRDANQNIELLAEINSYNKIKSFGPIITSFLANSKLLTKVD